MITRCEASGPRSCRAPEPAGLARTTAFTLVELLVAIAVLAVLVGILLPSLAGSRQLANQTKELAAAQQLMTAYHLYADEYRGNLLPGYATAGMTSDPTPPGQEPLIVNDETGARLYGVQARRYPWRLYPYLDYNFAGLYNDPKLLTRYRERADFQYVVSLSPSLGLNSTFCGGDADRFGFNTAALASWGPFYVTRADQPSRPAELIVFASARGLDPDAGDSAPVQGYFRVDAPYLLNRQWSARFDTAAAPQSFGHLDLRYSLKAVIGVFDGHAKVAGQTELDDMRKWSNRATRPNWSLNSAN